MQTAECQLQKCIQKITHRTNTNGFRIPKSKTDAYISVNWEKCTITLSSNLKTYKFLGVIFDRKLTFIPHIKYLKTKSTWAQQFLWVVAHTELGADQQTLLKIYRSLIHSKLDYAIFINRSVRRSYLKQLDPIHHKGLRQVLGAFRTSPVDSLYAKPHGAPLQFRCEKLALQYNTKLKSCPSNKTYDCILNPKCKQHFEKRKKSIKPFGLQMKSTLQESKIFLNSIHESILPQTPPWIIKKPKVILELNELPKTKTHPSTYQEKFRNILQYHPNHLYVFTG